ncbi:multiubiquitin domain-containing protein [Bradyrhizobium sp. HKCCYLRH3099]|uniref:multiubiquitin domain-containing protein n=1 Tax=unclassified Bradyrhizobium TaxID=2631580 RepID=UPI003EBFD224
MPIETPPEDAGKHHQFSYTINGNHHQTGDRIQDARKLLRSSGFDPADDHVLIELLRPGSRSVGLDEDVALAGERGKEFRAFLIDRTFNFTVDEVGYAWGSPTIAEPEMRDIACVPDGKALVLDRQDEADLILHEHATIDLAARGTEHLRTQNRTVTVFYKEKPYELRPGNYTGAQLAAVFGVPNQYILDLVTQDGEFKEIAPNQSVHIKDDMHFVSHPPCGQSS